jgi:RimJ/RimL family protein N-acetyltransferase
MLEIPRVVTPRLVLRGLQESDFETYAVMMADPEITQYLGDGRPLSRADSWRQLATFLGHWALRGYGVWGVEHRETGAFMGRVGCLNPEGWPGFEIGYTLDRPYWGQGYATEAVRVSLNYARTVCRQDRVISIIRPANLPSIRVAERLGAKQDGDVEFFGARSLIYAYPPPSEEGDADRR